MDTNGIASWHDCIHGLKIWSLHGGSVAPTGSPMGAGAPEAPIMDCDETFNYVAAKPTYEIEHFP